MTLKEKVKEIKKAIRSGLPKRRIDVKCNGANVRKLMKGEKVSRECIEEMYESLLEYRKNPHVLKARREKYRNSHPDVPQKNKVKAIRKAVKSGTTKNHLDPLAEEMRYENWKKGDPSVRLKSMRCTPTCCP